MNNTNKIIKDLRRSFDMSQTELGRRVGVGKTTISNWETGYSSPDPDSLVKLSNIFNCTVDYLLGRTDSKNVEILSGDKLPPELRGIIDAIGVLKGTGLSNQDIQELLEMQAKLRKKT